MLIGRYDTYTEAEIAPYPALRYNQLELFVQDHWQVKPNVTIDYGVRYQYHAGDVRTQQRHRDVRPGALRSVARATTRAPTATSCQGPGSS